MLVDGEIAKWDLKTKEMVIKKTDGKDLSVKLLDDVEVRLDAVKTGLSRHSSMGKQFGPPS